MMTLDEQISKEYRLAPKKRHSGFKRTKHLLALLGLSSGTGVAEVDALDRLNDVGVVNTPTSVISAVKNYTQGSTRTNLLWPIMHNPLLNKVSEFLVSTGISGGQNNSFGVLFATGALVIGWLSARAYINADFTEKEAAQRVGYKTIAASVLPLATGLYLGSQSFLSVTNGVIYNESLSRLAEAIVSAGLILTGIYKGIRYFRYR
jgi:hypothetical protein